MKYECPECGSQLKYWEEFVFDKERTINKNTGKLNKKINKTTEVELETSGIRCVNYSCGFHYYGNLKDSDERYVHLDEIFENL